MIEPVDPLAQLKAQLLDAYVAKEQAEEKIRALRNVMAGIALAQRVAEEAAQKSD